MTKEMLPDLLYGVLRDMGGHGSIISICKRFWSKISIMFAILTFGTGLYVFSG